jgi:drug/metabolite transporter (DMT)-like permease
MKIAGIILIVAGVLMFIFRGVNFTQEKKVIDLGSVEVNKEEKKTIAWPTYAGIIAVVGGIVLVAIDRKK